MERPHRPNQIHVHGMNSAEESFPLFDLKFQRRFWAKVVINENGCWFWTGAKTVGYGVIEFQEKLHRAHRLSWVMHFGPIPAGLHILHHCDEPSCCRPDHLFPGTHLDNMRDCMKKGRYWLIRRPERRARGERSAYKLHPERYPRGEGCRQAKLTTDNVHQIRCLVTTGLSQRKIAKLFHCSQQQVGRIIRGESWKHC